MQNNKQVIKLKHIIREQRGSVLALSLLVFLFLGGLLVAVSPMIINESKMNTINRDMVDAQFAAEAGAKMGIAAIYAKKTSAELGWLGTPQNLTTSDTDRKYTVTITPAIDSSGPAIGTAYTVKSVGIVKGTTKKGISVVVTWNITAGSNAGIYNYIGYTKGAMNLSGGPSITGKIASDGQITIQNGLQLGDIEYTGSAPIYPQKWNSTEVADGTTIGTMTKVSSVGTLDVASLMKYTPTMPTFSIPSTTLPLSSTALTGSYNYSSNPTSGAYYRSSNFSNWNYTYSVASNQSIFIYVRGNYTIGTPITGGGNITIYATGDVEIHGNIVGDSIKIYAGRKITLSENTISGNSITLQSGGNFSGAGGSVSADSASGVINIYSGGSFDFSGNNIVGGTVTITTGKTPGTAVNLHGGFINSDRPTYITKIYSYGNAELTSTVLGGVSMVVATGTLKLYGMTSSAILIAQGDITSNSGTAAGLYSNGSITTSGSTIKYANDATANNATNAATLGLISGTSSSDMSVVNWNSFTP